MKKIIFNISAGIAATVLMLVQTGCTQDFEEINKDPNKIVVGDVSPYNMFENLLWGGASTRCYDAWYYGGEIVQHTASVSSNIRVSTYTDLNNKFFDRVWSRFASAASDADHMYELAEKNNSDACKAIALTFKAMNLEELTAMFGDIPCSEAFQARKTGNVTPKFDSQRYVYEQLFAYFEQANDLYATSPKFTQPTMDGMYGADMAKWRKFNNSLYMRALCRVSNRDSEMNGVISAKLQEMVSNPTKYPVFASNSDNATVKYTGTTPYASYFYNYTFSDYTSVRHMSQEMVKQMVLTVEGEGQVLEDPRTRVYFYKSRANGNEAGEWFGAIAGASSAQMDLNPSYRGILNAPIFCDGIAPYTYMEYAEVEMIIAEMTLKGFIAGGESEAKKHYETAVTASVEQWWERCNNATKWNDNFEKPYVYSPNETANLLASPLASWDLNTNKKRLIGNQKFLLLFMNSYQAFYEIQRTGYPELTIGEGTGSNNYQFPTRMGYPTNTIGTNPNNANEAIQRQGWKENNMREHMWYSLTASGASK